MAQGAAVKAFDRSAFQRLIALGRERGTLGPDDLRAVLPVDAMDVDDLVLLILELEEAGVSVEPEAFGPGRSVETALRLPKPDAGVPRGPAAPVVAGGAVQAPLAEASGTARPAPHTGVADDGAAVDRVVALAGLVAFLAIAAAVFLL